MWTDSSLNPGSHKCSWIGILIISVACYTQIMYFATELWSLPTTLFSGSIMFCMIARPVCVFVQMSHQMFSYNWVSYDLR